MQTAAKGGGSGTTRRFHQRCAVRIMYSGNKTSGQWRAHGRYIARDGAGTPAIAQYGIAEQEQAPSPTHAGQVLEGWQAEGDPRLWKLIVSPEFGERADLDRLTRELMARMEKDLGTRLEWVAVAHHNTEHPHVHVALRGIRDDKSPLDLPRDYVRSGVRAIAEDLCTRQLGYRNHLDAVAAERREIQERRFTSLDRAIERQSQSEQSDLRGDAGHFVLQRGGANQKREREQHIDARLLVLQTMGLAERRGSAEWLVRRDFGTVLKAMQRTTDRQKMLAAHGALLSDERLPLVVIDWRKLKLLEGRVLAHGEEEAGHGAGRHYMLLEGTDAQVHLIYYTPEMEEARSRGKLRPNAFVRLQKQFENGRPVLNVEDFGDAERMLKSKPYLLAKAKALSTSADLRSDQAWGGWLGRYQAAIARTDSQMEPMPGRKSDRER